MKASLLVLISALLAAACAGSSPAKPPLEPVSDQPLPPEEPVAASDADAGTPPASAADPTSAGTSPTAPPSPAGPPTGDEAGAQALLKQFVVEGADHAALTKTLRPTKQDYKALFDAKTAPKIESAQTKEWDSQKAVIKPKPAQTEVKVWGATGADLAAGKGNAKEFPGGYQKFAKHLVPSATLYRFKFVEPGKDVGTAYDGLAFVNGHWVITPKPWRALEPAGAKDEETDTAAKPGGKPKPRTKKK